MTRRNFTLVLSLASAERALGQRSAPRYPIQWSAEINGKEEALTLTGVGVRKRAWFDVYTIASYVDENSPAKDAQTLADLDVVKVLRIVMERKVDGAQLPHAFMEAISANYSDAETRFSAETTALVRFFGGDELAVGQQVELLHVPGFGLELRMTGKPPARIGGLAFTKAVWEIYFGPSPVSDRLRASLSQRLPLD